VQTTQALIEKSPHTHKVKYHRCIKLNHLSVTMSTVRPDEWLTRDCIFSSRRPMACVTFRVRLEKLVAVRVSVKLGERPPPLTSAGASPADDERQRAPAVTTSSGHAPEALWEDGELVLCRGVWGGEPFPLLATVPSSAQP
jgi:hypothetical protein